MISQDTSRRVLEPRGQAPEALSRQELEEAYRRLVTAQAPTAPVVQSAPIEISDPLARTWTSTEFAVTAVTTLFAIWVGYRLVVYPDLEVERALQAVGAVVAVAWLYVSKRTDLKKTAAEAGTTTIKTPATDAGAIAQSLRRNGG